MDFVDEIKSLSIGADEIALLTTAETMFVSVDATDSIVADRKSDLVCTKPVERVFCTTPVSLIYVCV
jgi:1,2-phenylacetyl-CoA epoxidase PaaB subunit